MMGEDVYLVLAHLTGPDEYGWDIDSIHTTYDEAKAAANAYNHRRSRDGYSFRTKIVRGLEVSEESADV